MYRYFTALGDSKTPLYFLIGSSVGNIILDYYFVACVGLGVAGVAWATFIAQGISAILALTFLAMRLKKINCEGTFQWLDLVLLAQIAAIAIPSIMQQSVLSIGNMFVQEIVNRYGSAVIAGYSGAIKLNTFAINYLWLLEAVFPAIRPRTWEQERKNGCLWDFVPVSVYQ